MCTHKYQGPDSAGRHNQQAVVLKDWGISGGVGGACLYETPQIHGMASAGEIFADRQLSRVDLAMHDHKDEQWDCC